jgi:uncharacterized protein (TIGR00375 family)
MKIIADLHLHSKYSRATSPNSDLEHLAEIAEKKGIQVVGTGDFTHPLWLKEIKEKLEPAEKGLLKLKNSPVRFLLTSEISCIYSKKGKVRKIHIVVLAPSVEVVEKINKRLSEIGNLKADGRPILGLDSKELLKIVLDVSSECLIVPAHVLTPWFGLFGSKSGFDSLEECFEEESKNIYALETGLSADPALIWRLPEGQKLTLISNSDAHSPEKLGREANVFETDLSYKSIAEAIKTRKGFLYTIEFYPQEGKYHYDGHRSCNLSLSPEESKKYNNICPVCGKPLTLGVAHRIEELANQQKGFKPKTAIPFKSLIPLKEIIAEVFSCGVNTKKVVQQYQELLKIFNTELNILLNIDKKELQRITLPEIAEGIIRAREGKVIINPGYDGVYGKIGIFSKKEKKNYIAQKTLFKSLT